MVSGENNVGKNISYKLYAISVIKQWLQLFPISLQKRILIIFSIVQKLIFGCNSPKNLNIKKQKERFLKIFHIIIPIEICLLLLLKEYLVFLRYGKQKRKPKYASKEISEVVVAFILQQLLYEGSLKCGPILISQEIIKPQS